MYKYMKEQQIYVKDQLENENCDYIWLQEYFKAQIQFLSHERLIHLIVTLFFSLLLLTAIIISFICPSILLYLLILMSNPEHFTPPVRILETVVPEVKEPEFW